MNDQLSLFAESSNGNGAERRGSLPHGAPGLLKQLQRQGLAPDCLEAAARLVALLDAEPVNQNGNKNGAGRARPMTLTKGGNPT
jgi:hypothetical protein